MARPWDSDVTATFERRLGKSAAELDKTTASKTCPDIWELSTGDVAIIGRDLTVALRRQLPSDVSVGHDERLVVIPRSMLIAAKPDIPNA